MAKRVLVVDDNVDVIKMVGLMLESVGYEIIAAQSGEQALVKAQTEKPDVVILDIMMPDMDGYEVCRRLRANPDTSHLPILMFTAKATSSDKVAGFPGRRRRLLDQAHPSRRADRPSGDGAVALGAATSGAAYHASHGLGLPWRQGRRGHHEPDRQRRRRAGPGNCPGQTDRVGRHAIRHGRSGAPLGLASRRTDAAAESAG